MDRRVASALWVHPFGFVFAPRTQMNRLFNKKRKKSPRPPQQPGASTNTVAGPEFRAETDIDPKGGRGSYQDLEVDRVDLTTILGERDSKGTRIVSQDKSGGGRDLPTPEASVSGVVDAGIGRGNDPTSECFLSLPFGSIFTSPFFSPLDEDTGDIGGGESDPAEALRGTCRRHYCVGFLLTYTSYEGSSEGHSAWGCRHSRRCRKRSHRWIRSSQSCFRGHFRRLC